MKDAVIFCGDYRRDYTLREQVVSVCEEMEDLRTGLVFGLDGPTDYDFIEEALVEAIESGVGRITVLHEDDHRFDAFEVAVMREYGEAFARIEVLPKRSSRRIETDEIGALGRNRLFESPIPGTAQPVESKKARAAAYVIFPFNAQVIGTAKAIKQFSGGDAKTAFDMLSDGSAKPMIYQPESLRTVCYQMAPEVSLRHFDGGAGLSSILVKEETIKVSDEEAFLVQLKAEAASDKAAFNPSAIQFFCPSKLLRIVERLARVFGTSPIPFTCDAPDLNNSKKIYELAKPIMADFDSKRIKLDQARIDDVLGKKSSSNNKHFNRVQHATFLIKEVHNNQKLWRRTNVSGRTRKQQLGEIMKSFYSQFGIDKDVATTKANLEAGGLGLAMSAAGFLADVGKRFIDKKDEKTPGNNRDEKDASDRNLLVSHPSFADVLRLIDDDAAFSNDHVGTS